MESEQNIVIAHMGTSTGDVGVGFVRFRNDRHHHVRPSRQDHRRHLHGDRHYCLPRQYGSLFLGGDGFHECAGNCVPGMRQAYEDARGNRPLYVLPYDPDLESGQGVQTGAVRCRIDRILRVMRAQNREYHHHHWLSALSSLFEDKYSLPMSDS